MKIRFGFVSNSSSSSFILRGIKVKKELLIEALNITHTEIDECDCNYEVLELIQDKLFSKGKYVKNNLSDLKLLENNNIELDAETTGNYFGEIDFDNLIVGKYLGTLKDGEVTEIYEDGAIDQIITKQLEKLGITGNLRTYVQMISNDNY